MQELFTPIAVLNPVMSSWTIKGKVTEKTDLKRFKNYRGEGCVFSIELLDN